MPLVTGAMYAIAELPGIEILKSWDDATLRAHILAEVDRTMRMWPSPDGDTSMRLSDKTLDELIRNRGRWQTDSEELVGIFFGGN